MLISIGSKNPQKILAAKEGLEKYFQEENMSFIGLEVISGVSEQPFSLVEMLIGATNRAKGAYQKSLSKLSVGFESGIEKIDAFGYVNFCVCALYDGKDTYQGISPGFKFPDKFVEEIKNKNVDMSQALFNLGVTKDKKIGYTKGYVGMMTKDVSSRKEYMIQALNMAMMDYHTQKLLK